MSNQEQAIPKSLRIDRMPNESNAFYERRLTDPLDVVSASPEDRIALAGQAKQGLMECSQKGYTREAIEFAADYAYRSFGVLPFDETIAATKFGMQMVDAEIKTNTSLSAVQELGLQMRLLDFMSLRGFAEYHQVATGETDQQKQTHYGKILESRSANVIKVGASTLGEYSSAYEEATDESRMEIAGKMFELLYATYDRLDVYEQEQYEEYVVLGATEFEDGSATYFPSKSHNYDVIVLDDKGNVEQAVQCKSSESKMEYAYPIQKVSGTAFRDFLNNPAQYVAATTQLVNNPIGVGEPEMRKHRNMLENLFRSSSLGVQQLGKHAVRELP